MWAAALRSFGKGSRAVSVVSSWMLSVPIFDLPSYGVFSREGERVLCRKDQRELREP